MKVLVDTCVWSHVLRHKDTDIELSERVKELIRDDRVVMIGPIRQEVLSGISDLRQFKRLQGILSSFEDIPLESEYFVKAAEFSNVCRNKGIQGSAIDSLICAVAYMEELLIFTTDNDFKKYREYLPIRLFEWNSGGICQ